DLAEVDVDAGQGADVEGLSRALAALGLEPGPGRYPAGDDGALAIAWERLHDDLVAGIPGLVTRGDRFVLAVGYDADADALLVHDPAEGLTDHPLARAEFLQTWRIGQSVGHLRLRAGARVIAPPIPPTPRPAAVSLQVRALRARLGGRGFTVRVEEPFVVVGDLAPADLAAFSTRVIRWAVDHLRALYFEEDPVELITAYLFRDADSYERYALELWGEAPDTPYGYYSRRDHALIMNIATGGGTLVHELVHPLMESNFPDCPSWFDEGLASLYEQSAELHGELRGLTNWRLAGLQRAIREGPLPSFEALCATGHRAFYREDPGTNYAQARYLCYWLQEHHLLRRFYRSFSRRHEEDPSGYAILREVIGRDDMRAFQREWERYVLGLRYG
ncbi:MAG: hypothetical protein KC636_19605, partial [Myxococcales bacterium]|nr:hypothetical protein [Myxococcales bacterium]